MKIGTIELTTPTVLAPLAGITNLPLRLLAKEAGCGLVCSEMISANGLVYNASKTVAMLHSTTEENPLSIQIFGRDPTIMAEAARIVAASNADILDINFGCSVRKILKSGSGSALMRDLHHAEKLIQSVRAAINIPLTIKMRSGWDSSGQQAMELAWIAQECGVNAVTVHPRTARQGFTGSADWRLIRRIKQKLEIPVIGNGDIVTAQDALDMLTQTGCDAVMIGRSAMGNPLLFRQIADILSGRSVKEIQPRDRIAMMDRFLDATVHYLGEKKACFIMRSRLAWFAKGLPHATQFRNAIRFIRTQAQAQTLIHDFADRLFR
jgi:tRNA-dihydrouridine synthase B